MTEHDSRGTAADRPDTARPAADPAVGQPAPAVAAESPVDRPDRLATNGSAPPVVDAGSDGPASDGPASDGPASDGSGSDGSGSDGPASEGTDHAAKVAAWRERSAKRTKPKRPFWVELPILILIAFGLTFLIQTFIAKVYYVPSGSMEKTLHGAPSGGDRILANKIVYDFRDPQRGDVVVFRGPENWTPEASIPGPTSWFGKTMQALGSVIGIAPPNEKDFVKRVIAVGGESVACCDAGGNVTINGQPLDESAYIYEPIPFTPGVEDCTTAIESKRCFGPYTVPVGELWVMGDHRSYSADSSYGCQGLAPEAEPSCQGPVPVDNVIGKAVFIVMPPSRWGTIGNPDVGPQPQASASAALTTALPTTGGVATVLLLRGGLALMPGRRRRRRAGRARRRTDRRP